jgi:hypothetical protein
MVHPHGLGEHPLLFYVSEMTHLLQLLLHSARDSLRSGIAFQMTQSVSDQRILIESRVVIVQEAA